MHQQTDTSTSPYYHHPYYPYPATAAADPPPPTVPTPSTGAGYASAPPMSFPPANYTNSYPPSYDPNPNLQYTFPHSYPQNQNQPPVSYDYGNPTAAAEHIHNPQLNLNYDSQFHSSYGIQGHDNSSLNGYGGGNGEVFDSGVYKYNGGGKGAGSGAGGMFDDYGGKGGGSAAGMMFDDYGGKGGGSAAGMMFDDYGRPISGHGGKERSGASTAPAPAPAASNGNRIVKAAPKMEESGDVRSGVQKFRVKILSEGYGQTDMDVLCQIGLDGIRVLDPETSRMLKIYPLDTVIRWEVLDSYIFAFWAKSGAEPEPRRVRLKSNSYTTNNILDTVTAASIQSKEIGADSTTPDVAKGADQSVEKKRGFIDWKNIIKPVDEEKDHWVPDEAVKKCNACRSDFSAFNRKHHCRNCGDIFCDKCTQGRIALTGDEHAQPVRVCDQCMAEVTQRLSNNHTPSRTAGFQSHEDLAKKLQEEMDKKRKTGSKTEAPNTRMREVACPTCTVHLQVAVPTSGSETIECSVCQHPFLVNGN